MAGRKAIVVGGGVIGGAVAYELACAGWQVTLYDRGRVGARASAAAAGMLAPLAEAHSDGPFVRLGVAALEAYPGWLQRLADDGADVPRLYASGLLRLAADEDEWQILLSRRAWLEGRALAPPEVLDAAGVRRLEPGLAPALGAIRFPDQKHVAPRALVDALFDAAAARSVTVCEERPVTRVTLRSGRVTGVETPAGRDEADVVILAAGAWSGRLAAPLGLQLGIRPVRGQLVCLHARPRPIRHIIFSAAGYLVPKAAGRIFVGATEEEAGFDASMTAAGLRWLLEQGERLLPSLAQARVEDAWAGLRPRTGSGLPIMEVCSEPAGLALCTGHFRNGILLAPVSARSLAERLDGRPATPDEAAFSLAAQDGDGHA